MIGQVAGEDNNFPSGILLTKEELGERGLGSGERLLECDGIRKVTYDGADYYFKMPGAPTNRTIMSTPKRQKIASRRVSLTPEQSRIVKLNRHLSDVKDRLRKLKMLEKSETENADLPELIDKWRKATLMALAELQSLTNIEQKSILRSMNLPYEHLRLELSGESEADEISTDKDTKPIYGRKLRHAYDGFGEF